MIRINSDLLYRDLSATALKLSRCSKYNFIINNYGSFSFLNEEMSHIFDKEIPTDLINEEQFDKEYDKEIMKSVYDCDNYLDNNKDLLKDLSSNFCKLMKDADFKR